MSPVSRSEAHRTRLTAGIGDTSGQPNSTQIFTGIAYGHYFRMRTWVFFLDDTVHALADDLAIFYNNCAKWAATKSHGLFRESNCLINEFFVHDLHTKAEVGRFELPVPCGTQSFQDCALDRYANPPTIYALWQKKAKK